MKEVFVTNIAHPMLSTTLLSLDVALNRPIECCYIPAMLDCPGSQFRDDIIAQDLVDYRGARSTSFSGFLTQLGNPLKAKTLGELFVCGTSLSSNFSKTLPGPLQHSFLRTKITVSSHYGDSEFSLPLGPLSNDRTARQRYRTGTMAAPASYHPQLAVAPPSRTATPTTGSATQTATSTPANEPATETHVTLRLRGAPDPTVQGPRLRWAEDVVDNEGLGRKRSKGEKA